MKIDEIFIKRSNSSRECVNGFSSTPGEHGTIFYGKPTTDNESGRESIKAVFFPNNNTDEWAQKNPKEVKREVRSTIKKLYKN